MGKLQNKQMDTYDLGGTKETGRGSKLSQNGWAASTQQSDESTQPFMFNTKNIDTKTGNFVSTIQKLHLGNFQIGENSDIAGIPPPPEPSKKKGGLKKSQQSAFGSDGYRLLQRKRQSAIPIVQAPLV